VVVRSKAKHRTHNKTNDSTHQQQYSSQPVEEHHLLQRILEAIQMFEAVARTSMQIKVKQDIERLDSQESAG
jgi:hypothetical protein